MTVRLIRAARITHQPGETVTVSPAEGAFLISTGSAVEVRETAIPETEPAPEKRETRKKTASKK